MKKIIIFSLVFMSVINAADGNLDSSFSTDGLVTTNFGGTNDEAFSSFIQPDSKIVAVGITNASGTTDFALARYNADGSLDTSFGTGGKVTSSFGTTDDAFAAALQVDGKIIAAGDSDGNYAVARYNPNGSLDTSFGTNGLVTVDLGTIGDQARAVLLQPDGKILTAGTDSGFNFVLIRYNTNGSLDSSFGTGGIVLTSFGGGGASTHIARAVLLQPDGKIIAVGFTDVSGNFDFALARYNADGSLDTSFGTGGLVTTNFTGGLDQAFAAALLPDGKIIVAGTVTISGATNFGVARYNTNGSLDTSFGTSGLVSNNFVGGTSTAARGVDIESDGKIVVGGFTTVSGSVLIGIMRFNANGALDTSFGTSGQITTNVGGTTNRSNSIVFQPDGKIIAAGMSNAPGASSFALARYLIPSITISTLAKDIRAKYSLVTLE